LKIEVWSDIACPWCWLGKRHLQEAIRRTGVAAEVAFRSFELQPQAGAPRPVREYLAERYGSAAWIDAALNAPAGASASSLSAIAAAHARLEEAGKAAGIAYDFEPALVVNTFDAHRVAHLAKARGLEEPVMERLMRAAHGEGADVSDRATLRALAVEAGLDAAEVDAVLAGDAHAADVRHDEALAARYGIRGVPFFVFDGRIALSGAQPVDVFERVLRGEIS